MVEGDIASAATAEAVVGTAMNRYGRIDILVNGAGYGPPMPLVDLPEMVWDETIDGCLKGPYLMTRAVLPPMLEADAGRIIQVPSTAGKAAEANRTAYCAAKWGLQGFSLALRAELAGTGVRLHVINPAGVATGWWTTTGDPQGPAVLERMLTADDVAQALLWMLTLPDHVQVGDLVVDNARPPWSSRWPAARGTGPPTDRVGAPTDCSPFGGDGSGAPGQRESNDRMRRPPAGLLGDTAVLGTSPGARVTVMSTRRTGRQRGDARYD